MGSNGPGRAGNRGGFDKPRPPQLDLGHGSVPGAASQPNHGAIGDIGDAPSTCATQNFQHGSGDQDQRRLSQLEETRPIPPIPRQPYIHRSLCQATKDRGEAQRKGPPVIINAAYARANAVKHSKVDPRQPDKPHGRAGPPKRAADSSASESERRAQRPRGGPSPPSRHASMPLPPPAGGAGALEDRGADQASTSNVSRMTAPSTALNPAGRPSPPPEIYRGSETPGAWILTAPVVPASSHGAPSSIQGDAHHDRPTLPAALRRDGARANIPSNPLRSVTGRSTPPQYGAGLSLPESAPVSPVRSGANVHVQPGAAAASSAAIPHATAPTPVSARERSPAAQSPVNAARVPAHGAAPVPQPATTNAAPAVHTATEQPSPLQPGLGGPPGPTSLYLCTICRPGSSPAFQYPVALDHVLNQHHQPLVNAFNDQALSELRELSGTTEKLLQCIRCGEPFGAGPNQMGTAIGHVADRHLSRIRKGMIVLANGYMKPVAVPGAQQQ